MIDMEHRGLSHLTQATIAALADVAVGHEGPQSLGNRRSLGTVATCQLSFAKVDKLRPSPPSPRPRPRLGCPHRSAATRSPSGGLPPHGQVRRANRKHPLAVHLERRDRGAAGRGQSYDAQSIGRPREVPCPGIAAGMKQRDFGFRVGVPRGDPVRLAAVAVEAREGDVRFVAGSTRRQRRHVIDGEPHILPALGRMAALASQSPPARWRTRASTSGSIVRRGDKGLSLRGSCARGD